jgi:hypothetical protein
VSAGHGRSALDSTDAGLTVVVLVDSSRQHFVSYYVKNGIPKAEQGLEPLYFPPLLCPKPLFFSNATIN